MKTKTIIASALLATVYAASADITAVTLEGTGAQTINLTTDGSTDWIMLGGLTGGAANIDNRFEKSGADYISAVTVSGTKDCWDDAGQHKSSWTDGAVTAAATDAYGDWEAKPETGVEQFLAFSVDGLAVGDYQMKLYTSSYDATQNMTATIGASTLTATTGGNSNDQTYYSVDFSIDNAGDSMDIKFAASNGASQWANVGMSAVTIAAVPEPATLGLIAAFGGGLLFIRRRFMM